ncbi:MAG: MerC domain-containing protein [Spirosomataceae bacterium]
MNQTASTQLEKIGFWLSVACAIHCLAMPVLITLLPFVGSSFLADHETELYVLGGSWLLAGVLLFLDFRKHHQRLPLILLAASIGIKLLEVLVLGEAYELIASPLSGLGIAVAYYFNWRYNKACACGHAH